MEEAAFLWPTCPCLPGVWTHLRLGVREEDRAGRAGRLQVLQSSELGTGPWEVGQCGGCGRGHAHLLPFTSTKWEHADHDPQGTSGGLTALLHFCLLGNLMGPWE